MLCLFFLIGVVAAQCDEPQVSATTPLPKVLMPQTQGGLNNQIIHVIEALTIAKHIRGVVCMPMAKTDAFVSYKLPPVPLSHLLDVEHLTECAATKFGAHFASSPVDMAECAHLVNVTAVKYNVWNNELGSLQDATLYPSMVNRGLADVETLMHVYDDRYHAYTAYVRDSRTTPILVFPNGTLQNWAVRNNGGLWPTKVNVGLPMVAAGCVRVSARWRTLAQRIMDHACMLAQGVPCDQMQSSGPPLIGLHMRMESNDLRCAPSFEWIAHRMCTEYELPCATSVCVVVGGVPLEQYQHILPCQHIVTKESVLSQAELAGLGREEYAAISLHMMRNVDYFMGCGWSTFSGVTWSSRSTEPHHVNLAYTMEGRCWPGNQAWIKRHDLPLTCTSL